MVPWRTLTRTLATFGLLVANAGWAGAAPTISVFFGSFPGRAVPVNVNGIYGPPGTTEATPLSDEFASLGIVFTAPRPTLLVRAPACTICGVVAPSTVPGDVNIRFLLPVVSASVTIIGSGSNIAARLHGFNDDGGLIATASHTYSGPTGQPSTFTLTAPPGESFSRVTFDGAVNPSAYASMRAMSFELRDAPPPANEPADGLIWDDQFNGTGNGADTAAAVAAEGDRVFVAGTTARNLFVLPPPRPLFTVRSYDAWTGNLLWEDVTHVDGFGAATAIAARDGRVFVGGSASEEVVAPLRAYDAMTGALLWQQQIHGISITGVNKIAVSEQYVYAVGRFGFQFGIRAYDVQTGAPRWEDIAVFTNVSNATGVVVDQGRVFVVGGSLVESAIRAYDADTGAVLWDVRSAEYQPAAVAVSGETVYTAGRIIYPAQQSFGDFAVRAYDRSTGQLLWEDRVASPDGNSGGSTALVTNGRRVFAVGRIRINDAFAGTGEFAVRAYDAETGRTVWMDIVGSPGTFESASSVALRQGQLMVAGSLNVLGTGSDFVVRTYDAESGELLWDDFVNGTANAADGAADVAVLPHAVYVAGSLRNIAAFEDFTVRAYYK